jgi:hypothetical protein
LNNRRKHDAQRDADERFVTQQCCDEMPKLVLKEKEKIKE